MDKGSGLSSNWKKLQASIKAEPRKPPTRSSPVNAAKKRKRTSDKTDTPRPTKILHRKITLKPVNDMGMVVSVDADPETEISGNADVAEFMDCISKGKTHAIELSDRPLTGEDLVGAYQLGVHGDFSILAESDRINAGLTPDIEVGKYIGIDCEMVGVGPGGSESSLARISIVDFFGRQIYDSYVRQTQPVRDWRTAVSGIEPRHMGGARSFDEVQTEMAKLLKDRILVGHDLRHDLNALMLSHPARDIRDTAKYPGFRKYGHGRKPALRRLAKEILNIEIQDGAHSSVEDARTTMLLFRKYKSGFDQMIANHFGQGPKGSSAADKNSKAKKNKKKKKTK